MKTEEDLKIKDIQVEVIQDKNKDLITVNSDVIIKSKDKFNDKSFWKKIGGYAKRAGCQVIFVALVLYYTLQNPEIPTKVKAVIIGALGYFISPLDIIPDFIFGVGYTDDISVLLGAIGVVISFIDDDVKNKAKDKLKDWFNDCDNLDEVLAKMEK